MSKNTKIKTDKDGTPMIQLESGVMTIENGHITIDARKLPIEFKDGYEIYVEYEFNEETGEWEEV